MPRKKINRIVHQPPLFNEFKPSGVAGRFLKNIELSLDEYEALRLADYLGMTQEEAALEMDISRPTFTRIIENARKKLTEFIVTGKKLRIRGGDVHFRNNVFKCLDCGQMFVIDIKNTMSECPSCKSTNIVSLAGGYGHGRCCVDNRKH